MQSRMAGEVPLEAEGCWTPAALESLVHTVDDFDKQHLNKLAYLFSFQLIRHLHRDRKIVNYQLKGQGQARTSKDKEILNWCPLRALNKVNPSPAAWHSSSRLVHRDHQMVASASQQLPECSPLPRSPPPPAWPASLVAGGDFPGDFPQAGSMGQLLASPRDRRSRLGCASGWGSRNFPSSNASSFGVSADW